METEKRAPDAAPLAAAAGEMAAPPRVDSVVFARRRESIHGHFALSAMPRLLSAGVEGRGVLEWEIEGSVGRDQLQRQREFLRVQTRFAPWMTCSRCLEPVEIPDLRTDTRFRFAASEEQAAAEDREAEEEEILAASPNLDLAALVEDEAILALPMAPAHAACEWRSDVPADPGVDFAGDV